MKSKLLFILLPLAFSRCFASLPAAEPQEHSIKQELNHQFIEAAKEGSTTLMLDLLKKGTTVTRSDGTIIQAQADVNARDDRDTTALHYAAEAGHLDCVKALVGAQAAVNASDCRDETALHKAAGKGQLACLKALIEAQADIDGFDKYDATALHYAATFGSLDCVKALIEAGAYINARTENGSTAYLLAAEQGHLDCVKALVKYSYTLVASEEAVSQARKRIFNSLLQFVWLRNKHPELDNLKAESLQYEILSWNTILQEDLVSIFLDELKKGREIKGTALLRSKEAVVPYLLRKVEEIVSSISFNTLQPAVATFFDPANLKETLKNLIKEGLDERIEQLKAKKTL